MAPSRFYSILRATSGAWWLLFFFCPMVLVLNESLTVYRLGIAIDRASIANYVVLARDMVFIKALVTSVVLSTSVALLVTVVGTSAVIAAWLIDHPLLRQVLLVGSAMVFCSGAIPRLSAFQFLVSSQGIWGAVWRSLGVSASPAILYTEVGVLLGYLPLLLPLSVTVLAVSRSAVDTQFMDAARDLGAGEARVQLAVVLPLMRPGIIVSIILSFLLVLGDVLVVDLVGGAQVYTIAGTIVDYVKIDDWGRAAAASTILCALVGVIIAAVSRVLIGSSE
jgi:spermidine/putrescine transport system permease protein